MHASVLVLNNVGPFFYAVCFELFIILLVMDRYQSTSVTRMMQYFVDRGISSKPETNTTTSTTSISTTSSGTTASSNSSKWYMVPKSWFRYFYVVATVNVLYVNVYLFFIMKQTVSFGTAVLLVLFSTQVVRRLYENYFVHQFGNPKTSQMHIIGFISGALFYVFMPSILFPVTCTSSESSSTTITAPTHHKLTNGTIFGMLIAALLNLVFQYEQNYHHVLLASLRKPEILVQGGRMMAKACKDDDDVSSSNYKIPMGGWFQHVACPHYFFEILIYTTFGILLHLDHQIPCTTKPNSNLVTLVGSVYFYLPDFYTNFMAMLVYDYRYYMLLGFVVTNLYYTSHEAQKWYITKFGTAYENLHRKCLIPGII